MFMHGNKQPAVATTAAASKRCHASLLKAISSNNDATSAHFNLIKNYFTDAKYF